MSSTPEHDSRSALELLQATNRQMAERAEPPRWYHPTLGLMLGGLAAVQDAPFVWRIVYPIACCIGAGLMMQAYKRHTGMWIPGYRAGRTRAVVAILVGLYAAIFLLAAWASFDLHLRGVFLIAGALIAVLGTAAGYIWQWAYRRDLDAI
ncbi:MAG: hypothetical protein E7812_19365 [Phenylobacterium sp.]|nr:MAG: hypothetical protein E7812_19365 [Phenylobacterium sp.]